MALATSQSRGGTIVDYEKLNFQKLVEQKASTLGDRIRVMKQDAQDNWLRSLEKNGFSHSERVENYLNRLVPDNIKETFNPAEIFVLLYAVYLHDIGYLTAKDGHEKSSYEDIIHNFQNYKLNDRFEAEAVALVCYGHASEQEFPLKNINSRFGIARLSDNPLNLRFLAALLRLADEIDNAYTRVIGYPDQKESMRHLVGFVDIDMDRWLICFQTKPNNSEEWEKLDGMRKYTEERLRELAWVIESRRLLYNRIELKPEDNPFREDAQKRSSIIIRRKVVSILKLKGYMNIEENVRIGSVLVDLYGEQPIPDDQPLRTIVQCYSQVDKETVKQFINTLEQLSNKVERGFLVSEVPINLQIAELAKGHRCLKLQTLEDLLRNLIDFEHYLDWVIENYERDEISEYYVDLSCQEHGTKEILLSVHTYVNEFLTKGEKNHIFLLGEYGSGKTSFCKKYAHDLAMQYKTHRSGNRIPILVNLQDYGRIMNFHQFITDLLVNKFKLRNMDYDTFNTMNEAGLFLLVFDGFDEITQKVDTKTVRQNFEELAKAVVGKSKVLFTCRTEFFRSSSQMEELLSAAYVSSKLGPKFEILYLRDFPEDKIKRFLRQRVGRDKAKLYFQKMRKTYNLMELAQRPVLLNMIVEYWPKLIAEKKKIRVADLYRVAADFWLERDIQANRTFLNKEDKMLFMEELAFQMYLTDKLSIHYTEIPERIRQHFKLEEAEQIDYFAHDVMTCSFLNRDEVGNYTFTHKSFMEYFVARRLAKEIQDNVFDYFKKKPLTASINNFLKELLT